MTYMHVMYVLPVQVQTTAAAAICDVIQNKTRMCFFIDPVQTPISLDKCHIVSYISAKCETKQMYVFI